jgi:hypothetical protein
MRAPAPPAAATVVRPPSPSAARVGAQATTTLALAAALSLAVAWVHLAYAAPHLRQWWAYGAFFIATGAGQALFAPLILRRPRPWLVLTGIAGNVAIVGMYVMSRTWGPPLGPHAHVAETAGTVDLSTTAAEIVLVAILVTMLGARTRRLVVDALLLGGVLLWVLRLTGRLP